MKHITVECFIMLRSEKALLINKNYSYRNGEWVPLSECSRIKYLPNVFKKAEIEMPERFAARAGLI